MTNKECGDCKKTFDITLFNKKGKNSRGEIVYQTYCKGCMKVRQKKHYEQNKDKYRNSVNKYAKRVRQELRDIILQKKLENPCKCGESDPICLQFHHRDPHTKRFNIADAVKSKHGKHQILAEIDKCDILCANCHLKLHHSD